MPFSEFATLCMSSHLVLTSTPLGGCYFSCFTDEELEVESYYTVKLGIKPNKPVPVSSYCQGGKRFPSNRTSQAHVMRLTTKRYSVKF